MNSTNIKTLLRKLYNKNTVQVEHALDEIGRVGGRDHEVIKALQEFLRREHRMPLRIKATQTISRIKKTSQPAARQFRKPGIFLCPGAEKIKRVEIIDVTCPHCHKSGTASAAGFENEFSCEDCGRMIKRELPESCIEKCPVGSECVGEERYQKYMKGRKAT